MNTKQSAFAILVHAEKNNLHSVRMTRAQFKSLPVAGTENGVRNRPGRGDAPMVQVGPLSVQVTYVCKHDVHERTVCLDCVEVTAK